MSFSVAAESYDRYIGRYSSALAPCFLDFAGVSGGPVLEVGCGPGSLTEVLAARFGPANVAAVDPSEPFVAACRARVPGADVRVGAGEALPFPDGAFQGALSQLVLSFVREPDRLTAELSRVVRRDGTVAACTFEADGFALARTFWDAALHLDAGAPDDASIPFRREAELVALFARAGFREVRTGVIEVEARYADFEDFWSPFAFGIGPAGGYLAAQPEARRAALRAGCFERLGQPAGPFTLPATSRPSRRRGGPRCAPAASSGSASRPAPSRCPLGSSPSAGASGAPPATPASGAARRRTSPSAARCRRRRRRMRPGCAAPPRRRAASGRRGRPPRRRRRWRRSRARPPGWP
jgi:ubiquinone/menaquinone biosynthesis C-methylase UbiE